MNTYRNVKAIWLEIFKMHVVKNEHLQIPYFHLFLSKYIEQTSYNNTLDMVRTPVYMLYGTTFIDPTIHVFTIQDSGYGKGAVSKAAARTLAALGYNVKDNAGNFTDAAVFGSIIKIDKVWTPMPGMLGNYDYLNIDEARNLLDKRPWCQALLSNYNSYLDTKKVCINRVNGELNYEGRACVSAGTFMFNEVQNVLHTGLFPRQIITFKSYSPEEKAEISKEESSLAKKDYTRDLLPLYEKLREIKQGIDYSKLGHDETHTYVKVTAETEQYFDSLYEPLFDSMLSNLDKADSQDIASDFRIRYKLLARKMMVQYCVLNGLAETNKDAVDEIITTVKELLDNIKQLLTFTLEISKDNSKFEQSAENRCLRELSRLVKENPGLKMSDYNEIIEKHGKDKFYVGIMRAKALLRKMKDGGGFAVYTAKHNTLYLFPDEASRDKMAKEFDESG